MGKSSFFNKAFSIFVEQVPDEVEEVVESTNETKSGGSKTIPTKTMSLGNETAPSPNGIPDKFRSRAITNTPATVQAKFNEEFYTHFQTVIEDNDLEGADYFEFKKTFDALKATPGMNGIRS